MDAAGDDMLTYLEEHTAQCVAQQTQQVDLLIRQPANLYRHGTLTVPAVPLGTVHHILMDRDTRL